MAHDDNKSDQFIREVDEELRRDQMKALWDRFGIYIIATCILVVGLTAGYRGYLWWQEKNAAERGDLYLEALETAGEGNLTDAAAKFESLAAQGGGYAILARLQTAASYAEAGDSEKALTAFDEISSDTSVDEVIRDLARIRAALVAINAGDNEGARQRVTPLNVSGNPWRHAAREVLGTAAYAEDDLGAARGFFQAIAEDAQSPADARSRASLMLNLVDGILPPQSAGGATQ